MIKAYLFGGAFVGDIRGYYGVLSAERIRKIERARTPEGRTRSASSELLLLYALKTRAGCGERVPLDIVTGGEKPRLASGKIHFNISHTQGLSLCAVSDCPVGADAERIRETVPAVRAFTDKERAEIDGLSGAEKREYFFSRWTAKESALKLAGLSIKYLADIAPTVAGGGFRAELPAGAGTAYIRSYRRNGCYIAIASYGEEGAAEFEEVSEGELEGLK
ncbi:MAG: 4'-phosphopantetheinyl transferase superfamily protein [Clostridiales bacterium]|jgi:4'-phosphopantetheinyl transferase|nr:4'-phosphopantetheinyl transferase superfamily protein [Clostridiales bacterium]